MNIFLAYSFMETLKYKRTLKFIDNSYLRISIPINLAKRFEENIINRYFK